MKYISYCFMVIASIFLVILLSFSAYSRGSKTATDQPTAVKVQPTQVQPPTISPPAQAKTSQPTADATIKIHNFKFEPAELTIAIGKTVRFINVDQEPHTATSTDGTFNSKTLNSNEIWNYTATKPGTYPYICSIHPSMKGTLTVTP